MIIQSPEDLRYQCIFFNFLLTIVFTSINSDLFPYLSVISLGFLKLVVLSFISNEVLRFRMYRLLCFIMGSSVFVGDPSLTY